MIFLKEKSEFNVVYMVKSFTPPVSILSQIDPVYSPQSNISKIHFNIILPSMPGSWLQFTENLNSGMEGVMEYAVKFWYWSSHNWKYVVERVDKYMQGVKWDQKKATYNCLHARNFHQYWIM